jgi:replicative DNA helicase
MKTQIEQAVMIREINPNDLNAESSMLAHILRNDRAIYEVPKLESCHFYNPTLRRVFASCRALEQDNRPIDALTLSNAMQAAGTLQDIGGIEQLKRIRSTQPFSTIKESELAILSTWQRREAVKVSDTVKANMLKPEVPPAEILGYAATEIDMIANYVSEAQAATTEQQLADFYAYAKSRSEGGENTAMAFTAIPELDNIADVTGGSLVIVSGSTGSGKSSFYNTILNAHLKMGLPADSWSGENSVRVQVNRLLSAVTRIGGNDLKHGRFFGSASLEQQVQKASEDVAQSGITFTAGSLTASQLISRINYLHTTKEVNTFLFDRLELVDVSDLSRDVEQGRSILMERLRTLCVSLDIIIVIACQLRKSYENRPSCEPEIVDLKGTSAIGDSATHVYMLTRAEYHGITEDENGYSTIGRGKIMLLKHTEGELVDVKCLFTADLTLWESDGLEQKTEHSSTYGSAILAAPNNNELIEF